MRPQNKQHVSLLVIPKWQSHNSACSLYCVATVPHDCSHCNTPVNSFSPTWLSCYLPTSTMGNTFKMDTKQVTTVFYGELSKSRGCRNNQTEFVGAMENPQHRTIRVDLKKSAATKTALLESLHSSGAVPIAQFEGMAGGFPVTWRSSRYVACLRRVALLWRTRRQESRRSTSLLRGRGSLNRLRVARKP